MICKHCGAELSCEEWMKRVPKEASLVEALSEIQKWEEQVMKHYGDGFIRGCAEKYGKSGRLTI